MKDDFNEFGDFGFNGDSDFDSDTQLGLVEEAELKVLDAIDKYSKLTRDSIKFKEAQDIQTNFSILSRYITAMDSLLNLEGVDEEGEPLSDDELVEKIQNIETSVSEIGVADLFTNDTKEEMTTKLFTEKENKDDNNDDGSFDF